MRSPIVAASVDSKVPGLLGRLADNERWLWRLMLAPAILYIVLLVGFPFLLSLYYSVSDATVASREMHFVGLENFQRVIDSETFWIALKNTVMFTHRLPVLRPRVRQRSGDGAARSISAASGWCGC